MNVNHLELASLCEKICQIPNMSALLIEIKELATPIKELQTHRYGGGVTAVTRAMHKLVNDYGGIEINQDDQFISNSRRAKNMDKLKTILENKLFSKTTNEWENEMEKEKIPCGPIYNIKEAVENPQVEARNMIVKAYHKVVGDFKLAGNPIKMSSYKDEKTRGDIPDLDEHRKKIIKEFS